MKGEGNDLSDPQNILPDDYEYSNYEDAYDPNDVPEDQADPDSLSSYGSNDLGTYGATPAKAAPRKAAPVQPSAAAPVQPAVAAPLQPAVAAPLQPAVIAPLQPAVAAPVQPTAAAAAAAAAPAPTAEVESGEAALAQGASLPTTEYFDTTDSNVETFIDLRSSVIFTTGNLSSLAIRMMM